MKTHIKRGLALLLSLTLLLAALPVSAAAEEEDAEDFPDVPEGIWYANELNAIMAVQRKMGVSNIITGLYNDEGVLVFEPDRQVKRGEFLKMLFEAEESSEVGLFTTDTSRDKIHWAGKYYTKSLGNNVLIADVYSSSDPMFPCTYEALEEPITRYEMAVMLHNICLNIVPSGGAQGFHRVALVHDPEQHITDYADIPAQYVTAVEQMYGKGLLTGDQNGVFDGASSLTRAQAAVVIYRFLFEKTSAQQPEGESMLQDWAEYPEAKPTAGLLDPSLSFANWLRNGHVNSYGTIDSEARIKLFGSAYKTCFYSSYDAQGYMETISIPVWAVDTSGQKYSTTATLTVHKLVAEEVRSIFQMIFDDPEQFPIYGGWSVGGARFTDTLRHSWGCAIDVNALYNCECNTKSGYLRVTCGYGWWPLNTNWTIYAGSLSAPSVYSIGKNPGDYGHSVVEAFAAYGWGWGGNGWSSGRSFDYMHFSVLPSGG